MNEIYTYVAGVVATDVIGKTVDDVPVASFRLVSTARRFDRGTGGWVDGDKTWLTVTCWRSLARNVMRCVQKSERVVVAGRLRTRDWKDDEGHLRQRTEVIAEAIGHDLTFGTTQLVRAPRVEAMAPDRREIMAAELAERQEQEAAALSAQELEDLMNGTTPGPVLARAGTAEAGGSPASDPRRIAPLDDDEDDDEDEEFHERDTPLALAPARG
jgi:single-strand DNA-binding protein